MPWVSAKRDCEVRMLHRDVRSCGGNHLVPVLFHSHPVLRSEAASGSSVAQLHALLSPCQTPLAGTARGASQLLLVHAGSEADGSALALLGMGSAGRSGSSPRTSSWGRAVIAVSGFSEPRAQTRLSSKLSIGSWPQEHLPLADK